MDQEHPDLADKAGEWAGVALRIVPPGALKSGERERLVPSPSGYDPAPRSYELLPLTSPTPADWPLRDLVSALSTFAESAIAAPGREDAKAESPIDRERWAEFASAASNFRRQLLAVRGVSQLRTVCRRRWATDLNAESIQSVLNELCNSGLTMAEAEALIVAEAASRLN
jgi:hypothetical protein